MPPTTISATAPSTVNSFKDGLAILGLTASVITRVARDRKAMRFGSSFFVVAVALGVLVEVGKELSLSDPILIMVSFITTAIMAVLITPLFLAYFFAIHLCIRLIFGGTGSYWELVRPMMLSSPILVFIAIPVLGDVLAFWWSFSVLSWVGSAVYGVTKLRVRLLLLFGGLGFFILLLGVLALVHWWFGI